MANDFYSQREKNKRKTIFLILIFIILIGLLGAFVDSYLFSNYTMPFPIFTFVAIIIGTIQAFSAYYAGSKLVLGSLDARLANPNNIDELTAINVVQEMSIASGIKSPKLYIIPSDDLNAMATGRNPENACIGVTDGLIKALNREDLQGVVAHEMSHIKNYDILVMTMVSALVGAIVLLADWCRRSLFFMPKSKGRKNKLGGGFIFLFVLGLIVMIIAPIIARLLALAVSREREYFADATAVKLTRNPLGLANALKKIASNEDIVSKANKGSAHLFISDPLKRKLNEREDFFSNLFSTHPPIGKRINLLEKMAYNKSR